MPWSHTATRGAGREHGPSPASALRGPTQGCSSSHRECQCTVNGSQQRHWSEIWLSHFKVLSILLYPIRTECDLNLWVESSQLDVPEAKAEPPPIRVHRPRRLFFWESFTSSAVMLSHNLWPPGHCPKVKERLTTELTQAAWKPSFPLGNQPEQTQFVRQFPLSGLFLFSVFLGNYYPTWLSHSLTSRTGRERETRLFLWKLNCYAIYDFSCVQRTLSCLLCLVMLYSFLTDRINVLEVKEDKDGTIYLQTLQ